MQWICKYKYHLGKSFIKLKRMENYKKSARLTKKELNFFQCLLFFRGYHTQMKLTILLQDKIIII